MTIGLHLTLGFSCSKVAFGLSFSQSDSWNFSSLLITINWKIWRLFIFLILDFLQKKYFTKYFTIIFYDITILIPLSCGSVCSMPHVAIICFPLLNWRCVLYVHQGLYCTSCTPPCWSQTFAQMLCSGSTPSMALWGSLRYILLKTPPWLEP